ncbi:hypothetical protein CWI36_0290p0020 [Hamiltosporidium magnivora]|uniref:USP domain-containing protein n=2 Tax=Hamiltosporidium TaxID=1176354 RepID=A0A4Q9LJ77_9MICR|nr:hypothetical protein CWI36_0290p0020 [Hamiltosporidium magnivora]
MQKNGNLHIMKSRKVLFSLLISLIIVQIFVLIVLFKKQRKINNEKNQLNSIITSSSGKIIVGLKNENLVCYFNALLQAFYFQNNFLEKLFSYKHTQDQKCISILKEVFNKMSKGIIVNTSKYLKQILDLDAQNKSFKFGHFEDAGTCFNIFFLRILKELNNGREVICSEITDIEQFKTNCFIGELYFYQLKRTYYCSICNETNIEFQNNHTVCLYLNNSVQESINIMFNTECFECYQSNPEEGVHFATNIFEITSLGSNIIIKNTHFPMKNANVLINNKITIHNQEYIFKACVFHIIGLHYYTVASLESVLYKLDDLSVSKLNIKSIEDFGFKHLPDILIYEKSE